MNRLQHASCWFALLAGTACAEGLTRFQCQTQIGGKSLVFQLALDDATLFVQMDADRAPATYTASHVKFRPAGNGPVFLMGRVTGRLLLTDANGATLGVGRCTAGPIT